MLGGTAHPARCSSDYAPSPYDERPNAAGTCLQRYAAPVMQFRIAPNPEPEVCCFRRTLLNGRSKMLTAMYSGAPPFTTAAGRPFIARSGEHFGVILSFVRTGTPSELPASGADLSKLLEEAEFYQARADPCCGQV